MDKIEFKAFDRVLVRVSDCAAWRLGFFEAVVDGRVIIVASGTKYSQCIPYEGNEHLLGTTEAPKVERWKPKERETYFTIHHEYGVPFYVVDFKWDGSPADELTYSLGNCFRTEEEAKKVADKFNALLKGEE
ncbi:hypothetical protein EVA_03201 [gut metagenome]|uniref:Uncharacterized protein n=1 Tax=gut metagenome TaxID=749906 RepID=J9D7F1_9ZZZZ